MSLLEYNNIVLDLTKTNSVDRTVKLSDDGTEYVHTEWTISTTSIYNPAQGATSYTDDTPPKYESGILPMVTDQNIRHYLMQPRRPFLFQEGGIDILSIPSNIADGGAIDANNGPIPVSCSITRLAGARLFYVNYVIKCYVIECPDDTNCSEYGSCCALLSARYSRSDHLDEQYRSTMTTSGTAYFRSDILAQFGQSADFFRGMIIPPLLVGYKRNNVQFTLHSSGTSIEFVCTDVESFIDLGSGPPNPSPGSAASYGITDVQLRYSCGPAMGGSGGLKIVGYGAIVNVFASAKGQRAGNTLDMVYFCIAICVQKLGVIFGGVGGVLKIGIPTGSKITEDVFQKEVTVSMDFFVNGTADLMAVAGTNVPIAGFIGNSPFGPNMVSLPNLQGQNPQPPFSSGTRGTLAYQLAVAEFAQSCYCLMSPRVTDPTGSVLPGDLYTPSNPVGTIPSVQGFDSADQPALTPFYRRGGAENFRTFGDPDQTAYMEYRVDDDWDTSTGMIQLPLAGPPPQDSESGGFFGDTGGLPVPNDPSWYTAPSCVVIRLFNPMTRRVVKWAITRVGCIPEAPDAAPSEELDDYFTLLRRKVSPKPIELDTSGGVPIYRIYGEYTYAVRQSSPNEAYIPFAIPPWVAIVPGEFTEMEPGDWLQGILNYPTTNQSSGFVTGF